MCPHSSSTGRFKGGSEMKFSSILAFMVVVTSSAMLMVQVFATTILLPLHVVWPDPLDDETNCDEDNCQLEWVTQWDTYGQGECQHGPEHDPDCLLLQQLFQQANPGATPPWGDYCMELNGGNPVNVPGHGDLECSCFDCQAGCENQNNAHVVHCGRPGNPGFFCIGAQGAGINPQGNNPDIIVVIHKTQLVPGEIACSSNVATATYGMCGSKRTGGCLTDSCNSLVYPPVVQNVMGLKPECIDFGG